MMSHRESPRPRLTVDLTALRNNYRMLAAGHPRADMAAVVKADCYGLGVERIAPALHAEGCRTFFVAYTFEGVALRALLGDDEETRICVFNGPSPGDAHAYAEHHLTPVLNTLDQLSLWLEKGRDAALVHVDTGMNRLGLTRADIETILSDGARFADLPVSHVMSHYAFGADPRAAQNRQQAEDFAAISGRLAQLWPEARRSLSASAGLFLPLDPDEALARPGIALYGAGPQDTPEAAQQTVATLEAPVLQLRTIAPGETCGYSGTFTATRETRLATIGIGYADGYGRSLSNRAVVRLNGEECPVVGNVSMDLIIADVTDCKGSLAPGDMAECFGPHIKVEDHAARAGTIAYEIFTAIGNRVERVYLG